MTAGAKEHNSSAYEYQKDFTIINLYLPYTSAAKGTSFNADEYLIE